MKVSFPIFTKEEGKYQLILLKMENKYRIKVDDALDFEFTKDEIQSLDVKEVAPGTYHILQNHRSFKAEITESDFIKKTYTVKINSNRYEVSISNNLDLLIEEMGLSLGTSQLVNEVKAPMPGLILDVEVKPGDEVKEGDFLLVLEAMKMENTLTAPRDGVIKSVSVKKGETVEKNQLLIVFEQEG